MDRRDFLKKAALGAAGATVVGACGDGDSPGVVASAEAAAVQGPEISWRMATSFPPSLDILHGAAERIAERVSELTGGRFRIRVYAAGEIVPALQVMDAVQQGTVQTGLTAGYYYIGKSPALAFDATVPFGLTARQQVAWLHHGGGLELLEGVYADFGIVPMPAGNTGAQMGGWFREPVNSLADLQGLRFRIPGIGGEIMTRLGASVQVLGGPEIYPALERGAIDATEWVGPYDDEKLGFHEIASNYYLPGWWEPGASMSLQVSKAAFDEIPESYQTLLRTVATESYLDMLARYDAENPKALARLVNDHGVQLRTFSDDILDAAWTESNAYLEEMTAGDATVRAVYDSWKAFRETSFPFFAGNEQNFARAAFGRIANPFM
ncbi:MAG: TRAP transporter substrate-binding protein DctP [Gemmatimonadetes bacterium]|nr:TRAP transporter substrate-binding protein DctP [Gemmatimonadota bacterium]NNF38567.1 TRAP transporter substrate-binding protein DctP [Gemmatimonadota bacterium]NNK61657.1 TRAP transporter substrate-binding protein DctP [Gemmatimonadota bacterium]